MLIGKNADGHIAEFILAALEKKRRVDHGKRTLPLTCVRKAFFDLFCDKRMGYAVERGKLPAVRKNDGGKLLAVKRAVRTQNAVSEILDQCRKPG